MQQADQKEAYKEESQKMTECWAIWDDHSKCWHCDIAGNVAWWPTKEAAEAQIQSFADRASRLNGGDMDRSTSSWFDNAEARILAPIGENQTKKPAAEEESGRALAQEGL